MAVIYKILGVDEWKSVESKGVFLGSGIDLADGFIHFSTPETVRETGRKHFSGRDNLLLVGVDPVPLGAALRWEPSRGGLLFPHLYAPLSTALAVSVEPLTRGADGELRFPDGIP